MLEIKLDNYSNQHLLKLEPYLALIASINLLAINAYPLGLG